MRTQTEKEEFYNWLTHGIGFLLSILGFILLLLYEAKGTFQSILSVSLYGSSLVLLYFSSTFYHFEKRTSHKDKLRILDHISIYVLIAGTYSPIVLLLLEDSLGWELFWTVWGIVAVGAILKLFFTGRFETISLILYVVMGWLIAIDFNVLYERTDALGLTLLALGGVFYTVGILFYIRHRVKFFHVVWHIFVLLGSFFHYLFIFLKVI
ncbi:hemolysin III family protein [uncultured Planktosalinus sp.]|uniref:PAQR family membrane homeostasis protein TrhA n=1 Tax=uncultured Planktosalinus sp. TaxID=1810935 RepID=UPI0030D98B8C